jgi:GntR family transcriptional repressor for pyruvate dehydrogenase complex
MLFGVQQVRGIATCDVAVERLRQQFHLGLVAPGSKLPAERRLSEEMRVARATLREALQVLAAEGYVEIRRGATGGAFAPDLPVFTTLMLKRSRRDLAACYRSLEFWEINQLASAAMAAERRTPAGLKRLRAAADALLNAEDAWGRRSAESQLCLSVAAASNNTWLMNAVYDSLAATLLPFAQVDEAAGEFNPTMIAGLVGAIESSNTAEANRHMRRLVNNYGNRLRQSHRSNELHGRLPDSESVVMLDRDRRLQRR